MNCQRCFFCSDTVTDVRRINEKTSLKDLNTIPVTKRKREGSGKTCLTKPPVDSANENIEECQKKNCPALVSPHVNGNQAVPVNSVVEVGIVEIKYTSPRTSSGHYSTTSSFASEAANSLCRRPESG